MGFTPMRALAEACGVNLNEYFEIVDFPKYYPSVKNRSNLFKFTDTGLEVWSTDVEKYFVPAKETLPEILYSIATGVFTIRACTLTENEYYLLKAYASTYDFVVRLKADQIVLFNLVDGVCPDLTDISALPSGVAEVLKTSMDKPFERITQDPETPDTIVGLISEYENLRK